MSRSPPSSALSATATWRAATIAVAAAAVEMLPLWPALVFPLWAVPGVHGALRRALVESGHTPTAATWAALTRLAAAALAAFRRVPGGRRRGALQSI